MANKLFLFCATLAFCVLLSNASIYRTVVEFNEDDATNQVDPFWPFRPECKKEFRQEQHLKACQNWIRKQVQGSPFMAYDDIENQWEPQQGPSLLQKCCYELRQEDQECVCPTLKHAAQAIRSQGQQGLVQSSRIIKVARNLPNVCKMEKVGTCPYFAIPLPLPPY